MWLTAAEALSRLNVRPQTLYASVSRGRIAAKPDPRDPRRSLYNRADVERLAAKSSGRPKTEAVATGTIRWGEPVLDSAISTVTGGRLFYRGQDAVSLAASATQEEVAGLLWQADSQPTFASTGLMRQSPMVALAQRTGGDIPSYGRSPSALREEASSVHATLLDALCGAGEGPVHARLGVAWGRPDAADPLRRALVLLADHELNASTFAARVAVSTGGALSGGALAGLATLSGPLHGTAALSVFALARRAAEVGAGAAVRERLAEGRPIPAAGHPLYPLGDPRYVALFASFDAPPPFRDLAQAVEEVFGEPPNVDYALAALAAAFDLPETAPLQIFTLARSVGWLAHMLEQAASGVLIRPRARYVGVHPVT